MALFGIFGKKETKKAHRKGFHELRISSIQRLTNESVKISFDIPEDLKKSFRYQPGQHLDVVIPFNGKEEHRSYSICSG
jgi:ring-1,2-phenylacetyl-CoA epoxidase subunit PaaE